MSITLLNSFASAAKSALNAEKDAQQKAAEASASTAFADLLNQTASTGNVPSDTTTVSGRSSKGVIPAVLIDAQLGGATSTTAPAESGAEAKSLSAEDLETTEDPRETFLEFARKTPAEKMRAMILSEMGLTEEDLKNLDAETRAEIEEKIRIRIEEKVRESMQKESGATIASANASSLLN
ncbi:hypothetical protein [Dongia sp.]|uniref:hypothetical protein n=1 Tax=Dongia sp. TaxID=1977262 RepID=UPI0035B44EFF